MQNAIGNSQPLTLTAPEGGVVSGGGYLIGSLFVVATESADAAAQFAALVEGVVELPRVDSEEWTEGLLLYWDEGEGKATIDDDSANNVLIGRAVEDIAASPAVATGKVWIDGVAR